MAKKGKAVAENGKPNRGEEKARSAAYFDREIRNDFDAVAASFAVAGDLATGRFSASVGLAVAANVRNAVRIAELRHKYGRGKAVNLLALPAH